MYHLVKQERSKPSARLCDGSSLFLAEVERSGASAAVDGLRQLLGDQDRLSQVRSTAKIG